MGASMAHANWISAVIFFAVRGCTCNLVMRNFCSACRNLFSFSYRRGPAILSAADISSSPVASRCLAIYCAIFSICSSVSIIKKILTRCPSFSGNSCSPLMRIRSICVTSTLGVSIFLPSWYFRSLLCFFSALDPFAAHKTVGFSVSILLRGRSNGVPSPTFPLTSPPGYPGRTSLEESAEIPSVPPRS